MVKIAKEGIRLRNAPLYGPGRLGPEHVVPHRFDKVVVGELMGPIEYVIKSETHTKNLDFLNIYHRWFWEDSPWGGPIALPNETWCQARVLSRWKYGPMNRQLWVSTEWEFHKPALVGQKVYAWLRVLDKYWKRGKPYVRTESWTENENGEVYLRQVEELVLLLDMPEDAKLR